MIKIYSFTEKQLCGIISTAIDEYLRFAENKHRDVAESMTKEKLIKTLNNRALFGEGSVSENQPYFEIKETSE